MNTIAVTTKNLIDSLRNDIKEFCYELYGDDNFMVDEIMKNELKGLGIINGDDEMIWKSPDKSLYFEVIREDANYSREEFKGYRYICTINVKNNLSVPICRISFSELDAIRILHSIAEFCSSDYILDDTIFIPMGIMNGLDSYTLSLENITPPGELDTVILRIEKYNPIYQCMANVVTLHLTYEQLNDLSFHLFFSLLIDIDVPIEVEPLMHDIEDYITTGINWVYARRRNQMNNIQTVYNNLQQPIIPINNIVTVNNAIQPVNMKQINKSNKLRVNIKKD